MSIARIIVGEHAGQNVVVVYEYEKKQWIWTRDDLIAVGPKYLK
jgi:hypothetical protein